MSLLRSCFWGLAACLFLMVPVKAEQAPLALVQTASETILSELNATPEGERAPDFVQGLIEQLLLPLLAQQTIAERVLGDTWQTASDVQRQRFVEEFRRYMVSFYTEVFRAYSGEKVSYSVDDTSQASSCCTIISNIYQQSGRAIEARYRLEQQSQDWKVTDVVVDGVSMVQSNRQQYRYLIERNGLDKVISMLEARNNQLRR